MSKGSRRSLLPAPLPAGAAGDEGLIRSGGQASRLVREKILVLGGPAALLLQVAHPLVAAGVVAHSEYRSDPLRRLSNTLDTMLTVAFGDRAQAEAAAARVAAIHNRVAGVSASGVPYRASDANLALWVHATLVLTAIDVFDRVVQPLGGAERAVSYQQLKGVGRVFGVTDDVMPPDYQAFETYVRHMVDDVLDVGDDALAIAEGIISFGAVGLGGLTRPAMRVAAGAFLPPRIREAYGLPWNPLTRGLSAAALRLLAFGRRAMPPRARYWQHYRVAVQRSCQGVRPG